MIEVKDLKKSFGELARDGMTMVIVTHEIGFARRVDDACCFHISIFFILQITMLLSVKERRFILAWQKGYKNAPHIVSFYADL